MVAQGTKTDINALNSMVDEVAIPRVQLHDWGTIDYKEAWDKQDVLFNGLIDEKIRRRGVSSVSPEEGTNATPPLHHLILCSHPHVYTLGKSGDMSNLLVDEAYLQEHNIAFYKNNRGGDITYHGPGQIVGYPILDLDYFFTDLGKYLRMIEESIILTLRDYGIEAGRSKGETGVWLDVGIPGKARKICAIGIRCSRWVVMHGFAFNITSDLDMFKNIIPCGITDKEVASLDKELGYAPDMDEVKALIAGHFERLFNCVILK